MGTTGKQVVRPVSDEPDGSHHAGGKEHETEYFCGALRECDDATEDVGHHEHERIGPDEGKGVGDDLVKAVFDGEANPVVEKPFEARNQDERNQKGPEQVADRHGDEAEQRQHKENRVDNDEPTGDFEIKNHLEELQRIRDQVGVPEDLVHFAGEGIERGDVDLSCQRIRNARNDAVDVVAREQGGGRVPVTQHELPQDKEKAEMNQLIERDNQRMRRDGFASDLEPENDEHDRRESVEHRLPFRQKKRAEVVRHLVNRLGDDAGVINGGLRERKPSAEHQNYEDESSFHGVVVAHFGR